MRLWARVPSVHIWQVVKQPLIVNAMCFVDMWMHAWSPPKESSRRLQPRNTPDFKLPSRLWSQGFNLRGQAWAAQGTPCGSWNILNHVYRSLRKRHSDTMSLLRLLKSLRRSSAHPARLVRPWGIDVITSICTSIPMRARRTPKPTSPRPPWVILCDGVMTAEWYTTLLDKMVGT